jgi:hypothetical protein
MYACKYRHEKLALELLKDIESCNIGQIGKIGQISKDEDTPLIYTCEYLDQGLQTELSEDIELCNIDCSNTDRYTALMYARKYNLKNVVSLLEKYSE